MKYTIPRSCTNAKIKYNVSEEFKQQKLTVHIVPNVPLDSIYTFLGDNCLQNRTNQVVSMAHNLPQPNFFKKFHTLYLFILQVHYKGV